MNNRINDLSKGESGDLSPEDFKAYRVAVLETIVERTGNDDERLKEALRASTHEELRAIWRRLLMDETFQDVRTALSDIEGTPEAHHALYPQKLADLGVASYSSAINAADYIGSSSEDESEKRETQKKKEKVGENAYPYTYIQARAVNGSLQNIDCTSEHFGYRAGDIIRDESPSSVWNDSHVLVEGFGYNVEGKDVVMWGRKILEGGGLAKMYYAGNPKDSQITLAHRWGSYDPRDFGFEPHKRIRRGEVTPIDSLTESPTFSAKDTKKFLANAKELKEHQKISPEKEPYKLEGVFDEYTAAVMRIEIEDLLKRMHRIFPIKNYDQLLVELALCKVPVSVQRFNDNFFGNLESNLEGAYTPKQISRIRKYLTSHREKFDVETILTQSCNWLSQSVELKTGIRLKSTIPEKVSPSELPKVIDDIVKQVADYLNPLFDSKEDPANRAKLFNGKQHYFGILMRNYANAYDAARHVVGVGFNGIREMLNRAMDYDYKHVISAGNGLTSNNEEGAAKCRRVFFIEDDEQAGENLETAITTISDILDKFDIKTAIEECIYGEDGEFRVSRSMSVGELLKPIEKIRRVFDGLKSQIFEQAGPILDRISPSLRQTIEQKFDSLVISYLERSKINEEILAALRKVLFSSNREDEILLEKPEGYPLKSIKINSDVVDCQAKMHGVKGGDIIKYQGHMYFVEGHYLNEKGISTHILLRVLYEDEKIVSNDGKWIQAEEGIEKLLEVVSYWGEWNPNEYNYQPLQRKGATYVRGSVREGLEDFKKELTKPLLNLKKEIKGRQRIVDEGVGEYISHRMIRDIKNPSGKNLPSKTRLLYFDRDIYSVYPFAPPSSSHRNVIRFEISTGCSWRRCTYCTLYEHEEHTLKTPSDFAKHFELVKEYMGTRTMRESFDRVFLSGGNGLSMGTDDLCKIVGFVYANMPNGIRRLESYATTGAILSHNEDGLRRIKRAGLNLVYWGVESGNDEVLRLVKKGYKAEQVKQAGKMLRDADIQASVTVMPGLGGIKFSDQNAIDTGTVMGEVYPAFLTLMSTYSPLSNWDRDMQETPDNRQLTREELIREIELIRRTFRESATRNPINRNRYTRIAAHGPDITPASCNPVSFSDRF